MGTRCVRRLHGTAPALSTAVTYLSTISTERPRQLQPRQSPPRVWRWRRQSPTSTSPAAASTSPARSSRCRRPNLALLSVSARRALRGAAAGATQRVARPRENLRIPRTRGTRKHREGEHQMPPVSTPWLQERAGRRRADKSAWGIRCGFNWRSPADSGRPSRLAKVAHDDGWVLGVRSRQAACQALRRPRQGRSTARSAHQPTR